MRLILKLSYSWNFSVDKNDNHNATVIFNVSDYVDNVHKAMVLKVREKLLLNAFNNFHKYLNQY